MATATEVTDVNLAHWAPGTRFYSTDDGRHFVVCVDETEAPPGSKLRIIKQPTVILYTDENAVATDLEVDFTFDPGTGHEDAVLAAGFDIN